MHKYTINKSNYKKLKLLYGGTICTNPFSNYFSGLLHGTSIDALKQILKDGKIIAAPGDPPRIIRGKERSLNKGAYFQGLFNCKKHKIIIEKTCDREVFLIFSSVLLSTREDYHISNVYNGGMKLHPADPNDSLITISGNGMIAHSYNNDQFIEFKNDNNKYYCESKNNYITANEIVFSNSVSLEYLQAIWICDYKCLYNTINIKNDDGTYKREQRSICRDPQKKRTH